MALVAHWPLDEGTGATAGDDGPNVRNGTIVGASWLATGGPTGGPCLSFNGVNDRVDIADHASIDVSTFSAYSMGASIRPGQIDGMQYPIVYAYGNWGASLELVDSLEGDQGAEPDCVAHGRNNASWIISNTPVTLDQWQHVVITRNATTTTFYYNGIADGSGGSTTISDDSRGHGIGNRFGSGTVDAGYLGRISDVRLYDHELSAQEVSDWHASIFAPARKPLLGRPA